MHLIFHSHCSSLVTLQGKSRHEKIVAVLDVVHAGTWEQFKGLIIALRKTNQEAVVSILRHEAGMITPNMSCLIPFCFYSQ